MMRITLEDVAVRLLPRPRTGRVLATGELRTLASVAEVLLEGAPSGVTPDEVAANVDTFLVTGKSRRAWRVRVLLRLVEVYPVPTYGTSFSRLALSERRRIVRERWIARGGLGRLCAKVRNLVILGAYGDKRAGASTGYVPVPQRPRFVLLRAAALRSEVA
jgi:hypothetical protein